MIMMAMSISGTLYNMKTVDGELGRTFSEARFFDEHERLVANMTQQCII